jgi:hypothetical protein
VVFEWHNQVSLQYWARLVLYKRHLLRSMNELGSQIVSCQRCERQRSLPFRMSGNVELANHVSKVNCSLYKMSSVRSKCPGASAHTKGQPRMPPSFAKESTAESIRHPVAPAFELITRRLGHCLRKLPFGLIPAEETLRFLLGPFFQRPFQFTLCAQFLYVAVLCMTVQISPIARREIGNVLGNNVVIDFEFCGSVVVRVRCGRCIEADIRICWCGAREQRREERDDEEEQKREKGL